MLFVVISFVLRETVFLYGREGLRNGFSGSKKFAQSVDNKSAE